MFIYPLFVAAPSPAAAAAVTCVRQEARVLDQLAELTAAYGPWIAALGLFGDG